MTKAVGWEIVAENTLAYCTDPDGLPAVDQDMANGAIDAHAGGRLSMEHGEAFGLKVEQGQTLVAADPEALPVVFLYGVDAGTERRGFLVAPDPDFVAVETVQTIDGAKPHAPFLVLGDGVDGVV